MLSTPQVTQNVASTNLLAREQSQGTPETGFDFLSYILGLQASPIDGENDAAAAIFTAGTKGGTEEGKATGKNNEDSSSWNMIFPGLSTLQPVVQADQLINGKAVETSNQSPFDLSNEKSPKTLASGPDGVELLTGQASANGEISLKDAKGSREIAIQKYEQNVLQQNAADGTQGTYRNLHQEMNQADVAPSVQTHMANTEAMPELKSHRDSDKDGSELVTSFSIGQPMSNGNVSPTLSTKEAAAPSAPVQVPELFHKVDSLVQNGGGQMTVSLNPPHLGQVEIQVTAKGKRVEIEMRSDNAMAKSLIENSIGDLRHSIQSQDLVLSKFDVQVSHEPFRGHSDATFANLHQQNQQTFHDQRGFSDQTGQSRNFRSEPDHGIRTARMSFAGATQVAPMRANSGRVDVRI